MDRTDRAELLSKISIAKPDSNLANLFYKYGETFEGDNTDSATHWYYKGKKLSEELNFINGQIRFRDYYSILLVLQAKYDEALKHIDTAFALAKKHNKLRWQAIEYNQYGTIYQYKYEMNSAAEYYLQAYQIADSIKDTLLMATLTANLSGVFMEIKRFDKARYFSQLGYDLSKALRDTVGVGYGAVNLSSSDLQENLFEKAIKYTKEALIIARNFKDEGLELFALSNYGSALKSLGKTESAIVVFKNANQLAVAQQSDYHLLFTLQGLGDCYYSLKDFNVAKKFFEQAIQPARQIKNINKLAELYNSLSLCEEQTGNIKQSLVYRKLFDTTRDSINIIEQNKNISELETKYQTEKKQRELSEQKLVLEQEQNKSSVRLFLLIGAVVLLVLLLIFIVQRIRLARQRELNFKNEMQVNDLRAREDERNRLAADMHDDLGSGLSTIRMLSEISKTKSTEEAKKDIDKISIRSEELVESMREMIWAMSAHNDSLDDLFVYIRAYSKQFFEDHNLKNEITLPEKTTDVKISSRVRRNIFLVVKELLHNSIKHSGATHIKMSIDSAANKISISIHDNGKGFPEGETNRFGNGIKNMKKRIADISGEISFTNSNGALAQLTVPFHSQNQTI